MIPPAQWARRLGLSLSHSSPRPATGAGAFCAPVGVWPMRRMVQSPSARPKSTFRRLETRSQLDNTSRATIAAAGTFLHPAVFRIRIAAPIVLGGSLSMVAFAEGVGNASTAMSR